MKTENVFNISAAAMADIFFPYREEHYIFNY